MQVRLGILIILFSLISSNLKSQHLSPHAVPDSITNVYVKPIHSDSLCSIFFISIYQSVKLHKHAHDTETIVILGGRGILTLGDTTFKIKKGQTILIPKGTPHAVIVKSKKPLTLYSIQAPKFVGKDRVWLN